MMWRLKSCPRCNGDVGVERDHWGFYEQCIQCGYLHDLQNIVEAKQQPVQVRLERQRADRQQKRKVKLLNIR